MDTDRPLTHINKKGRPVSQCPHCRGLRKSRASHVACECGVKPHSKEECVDERSESDSTISDTTDQHTCCCSHGMRCTCALKKEHLEPVPEVDLPSPSMPTRRTSSKKPRLAKAGSDNSLTVFANGHHKPIHKHNDSAHQHGIPYKIPIPHSVAGNADVARRSADSLPLLKRKGSPQIDFPSFPEGRRMSRSEHGSPLSRQGDQLPPLDYSYPLNESPSFDDYFPSQYYAPQNEAPPLSAGLSMSPTTDWGSMDLPGGLSAAYNQPSFSTFERPPLTTSSSGTSGGISSISEFGPQSPSRPELSTTSSDDQGLNRLSCSSFTGPPQTLSPMNYDYVSPTAASPSQLEGRSSAYMAPASASPSLLSHGTANYMQPRKATPPKPQAIPHSQPAMAASSLKERDLNAYVQQTLDNLPSKVTSPISEPISNNYPQQTISIDQPAMTTATSIQPASNKHLQKTSASPQPANPGPQTFVQPKSASPPQFEASPSGSHGSEAFERHGLSVHGLQRLAHPDTVIEATGGLQIPQVEEEKHIWASTVSPSETSFVSQQEVEGNNWQR